METAVAAFVTLFVVVDPIGLAPLFIALTAGAEPAQRRRIAIRAVCVSAGVLVTFGLAGEALIATLGIGLPAFRISGGLMLFLIALEMLFEKRTERKRRSAARGAGGQSGSESGLERDPSIFPLATPLIAGPGAMAAMILLTAQTNSPAELASVFGALVLVLLLLFALFLAAGGIERLLGPLGVALVTRILGVLLGALAVQFVLDGLAEAGLTPMGAPAG